MSRSFAASLSTLVLVVLFSSTVLAQPRFGVELGVGQNLGFTSYVDNVVLLQGERPILVDERPGSGIAFDLRFILSRWAVGGSIRLFDRDTIVIHHRGLEDIPPNRVRPDGSIDDAGIDYVEVEPVRSPSPQTRPGDLLVVEVGTAHRFALVDGTLSLFVPVQGSIVGAKILDPNRPTIFGFSAATGLGLTYAVAPPFGLVLQGLGHGLLTPAYRTMADTARTSFTAGETTEQAIFSTMVYGSLLLSVQFTVR